MKHLQERLLKSYRSGKTAIVWGYARSLAPLLAICLHWHEGPTVCVCACACARTSLCERAVITTRGRRSHPHQAHMFFLCTSCCVVSTCLRSVLVGSCSCIASKCDSHVASLVLLIDSLCQRIPCPFKFVTFLGRLDGRVTWDPPVLGVILSY